MRHELGELALGGGEGNGSDSVRRKSVTGPGGIVEEGWAVSEEIRKAVTDREEG